MRDVQDSPFVKPRKIVPLREQQHNVLQLLRDRGNDMITGPTIKDFAALGPPNSEKLGFTAEFVRRYFGEPVDPENPDSEYVEHLRGASHAVLEKRMEWMKKHCWSMWKVLNDVFPRDEGGDKDYELLKKLAESGNEDKVVSFYAAKMKEGKEPKTPKQLQKKKQAARQETCLEYGMLDRELDLIMNPEVRQERIRLRAEAKNALALVEWGLQVLAMRCQYDELFVIFAKAMTAREASEMKARNAEIASYYYEEVDAGRSEGSAMRATRKEYGLSESRIYQILALNREERGLPKRSPGRPRKRGASGE